ncbi:MAG: rhomboid family intramembrane serine protease [Chloroflexota bacterium]|nr:rhomboid family intramembrane serine protease [Chloroflexota bacterium]
MQDRPLSEEVVPESSPRTFPLPFHGTWLTHVILAINIGLFLILTFVSFLVTPQGLLEALLGGADSRVLLLFGAKSNLLIKQGEVWRLLTPIFLHIGLVHLLFNQYALSIFGKELESLFGTPRFATVYFLAGLFGSVASFAFTAAISAGASGAIFGIIGALAAFFLRNRETLGEMGRQQLRGLLVLIAINLFLGVSIPGIDNWGHVGGLVSGFLLGAILAPTYTLRRIPEPPFARVVERPPVLPNAIVLPLGIVLLLAATLLAVPLAPPG